MTLWFRRCPSPVEGRGLPTWGRDATSARCCRTGARPARSRSITEVRVVEDAPGDGLVDQAAASEELELVLVLPAPGAAVGLDDDVEREIHDLDAARGAPERLLEIDVPTPLLRTSPGFHGIG